MVQLMGARSASTFSERRTTFLQMQHGSLYPALHRLEERGWVISKWEMAPDRNREFKYYRLTEKGKKQLVVEESQWKQMAEAVVRVMWPVAEDASWSCGILLRSLPRARSASRSGLSSPLTIASNIACPLLPMV